MRGLDREGRPLQIRTDGLLAICLQHELDHLEGKLFIDRISFLKSSRIKTRIKKKGYPTQEERAREREARRGNGGTHRDEI
jgi:peptide deformylase